MITKHDCKFTIDTQRNEICLTCESLGCKPIKLNQLKKLKEKFFKLNPDSYKVYIVNHYNREDKTFTCSDFDDYNTDKFIKANKIVYIGFTF